MNTYIDAVNDESREAVMRLYGVIGSKVDGDIFAQELASLDTADLDLIRIRINSAGGNVFEGMSIVSAMLSMKTPVCVHIDGIAASMAAVIAVAADTVCMMDFAKMMIHDPYYSGANEKAISAKQKKALVRLTDMLRKVLNRRGMDDVAMAKLMKEETWFSAEEATAAGLCDEITTSARNEYKDLAPMQLVAMVESEYQIINQNQMEKFNLTAEAIVALGSKSGQLDEAAVNAAIVTVITAKNKEIAGLEAAKKKAEQEVVQMKKEQQDAVAAEALTFAEQLVKSGKITADAKDATVEMYKSNPENTIKILGGVPERTKLGGMLNKGAADTGKFVGKSWDELDKAGLLAELKAADPDLYDKKYKEMATALHITKG